MPTCCKLGVLHIVGVLILGAFSCGKLGNDDGNAIASVAEGAVSSDDLMWAVDNSPPSVRRRITDDLSQVSRVVERLVDKEILYQEALKRGIDKRPGVRSAIREICIGELRRVLEKESNPTSIEEDEVRREG